MAMKVEFNIEDSDLEDLAKIKEIRHYINEQIPEISEYGKNTLLNSLNRLIDDLQFMEDEWTLNQRKRIANLLSAHFNLTEAKRGCYDDAD